MADFIKIGEHRIPVYSIHSYGIQSEAEEEVSTRNQVITSRREWMVRMEDTDSYSIYQREYSEAVNSLEKYKKSREYKKSLNVKYLYVEFNTGEIMKFYPESCGFDIYKALNELDSIFM